MFWWKFYFCCWWKWDSLRVMAPWKVMRKAFQGPMHRRMWSIMTWFIGAKSKDYPQVPGVLSRTRWLSSVQLWKKTSLWSSRLALRPIRPRRARRHGCRTSLCLISPSACLPPWPSGTSIVLGCMNKWTKDQTNEQTKLGPLLSFDHIFLSLGRL